MSIGYDNSSSSGYHGSSSSYSFSHTTGSGSNRFLFVAINVFSPTASVSSVTYNGTSMSLLYSVSDSGINNDLSQFIYVLAAPTSGTHSVSVILSGTNDSISFGVSFDGVDQSNYNAHAVNIGNPVDIFTTEDNAWVFSSLITKDDVTSSFNAWSGTTKRQDVVNTGNGGALLTTAGPFTPQQTVTIGASNADGARHAICTATVVKPFVAAPPFKPYWATSCNQIIDGVSI